MKLLNEVKRIIQQKNLNIDQIFNNFDTDKGGSLDKYEFSKLLKVIKHDVTLEEVIAVIEIIDDDGTGDISLEEFKKIFYDDNAIEVLNELRRLVEIN